MTDPETQGAVDRLTLLADGIDVSGLDHLPIVSRANAVGFQRDLRLVLAALAHPPSGVGREAVPEASARPEGGGISIPARPANPQHVRADGWWSEDGLAWYHPAPHAAQAAAPTVHVVSSTTPSPQPASAPAEGEINFPAHQDTFRLVQSFSEALMAKLGQAEVKYGYTNGWSTEDWEAECQRQLLAHVQKGDPLDVAAYAAFCWGRGWSTTSEPPSDVAALVEEAITALLNARDWFRGYQYQHLAKGTPEGNLKADANRRRADECHERASALIIASPLATRSSVQGVKGEGA